MQQEFNDLVQSLRTKENEKNLASQKLHYLKEKETNLQDFLQKAEGQLKGLDESIAFTTVQIEEAEGVLETLQINLDEIKDSVDEKRRAFDEKRSAIDEIRRNNQQIQRNQFDAEKKVAVADTSIQNLQRSINQIQEERNSRDTQLAQVEAEKAEREKELAAKKESLKELQDHHERTKDQILQTQQELEQLRTELAEENRKLDSRKNEYALLKSLIDSMEGYPESIKFLHKNPEWDHKSPILQDIIYVKEEFRTAVENVLDPYLNYYVVNNLEEGLKAIQLLDRNNKGKANFFLLNQFEKNGKTFETPAGTIPATDVIEVDEQY
ncbi:MAG TPA: chromosome segregation protein SMC, partial [Parasegetibacter sp.]